MYCRRGFGSNSLFAEQKQLEKGLKMVIAVAGSGGKTTRIHLLTEKYRKLGKTVLVTTTTHMYREEGCDISGDEGQIRAKLKNF